MVSPGFWMPNFTTSCGRVIQENYGGGVRWHCSRCDLKSSSPGFNFACIQWWNEKGPLFCKRCAHLDLQKTAYTIIEECNRQGVPTKKISGRVLSQFNLVPDEITAGRMSVFIRALDR